MPPYNQYQIQSQIDLYRSNPLLFTENKLDELEKIAKEVGIPFDRNMDYSEASLLSQVAGIPGQVASGFLHGFSTIPVGPDPRGDVEGIARSVGHLLVFDTDCMGALL